MSSTPHSFLAITSEGGLLPADFLQDLLDRKSGIEGLDPKSYDLAEGEKINEQVDRSWNRLKGCWDNFKRSIADRAFDEATTTETRERWLLPLFQELGFGKLKAAKPLEIDGKSYAISHGAQLGHGDAAKAIYVPIHLVGSHLDLDRRTPGATGAAKSSPHSLVQQVLNAKEHMLWGMTSNGFSLRLLRDNAALTRLSLVEFDLQQMLDGDLYSEFYVLWLVCHRSRFEGERPELSRLEQWRKSANDKGLRALENLKPGVIKAIASLGAGLVGHKKNDALREKLRTGALTPVGLYQQILRVVYRVLFLLVADERDLLHPEEDSDANRKGRKRYRDFYSISRLRNLTIHRAGTPHPDLWQVLQLITNKLGSDTGAPELALPALGSFLWDAARSTPDLQDCLVSNRHLLEAVHALVFVQDGNVRRAVDYRNLGAEELGSVYEGLLELHPEINPDAGTFELKIAAGNERKTSGSYYTPDSLVQCLLDSALEPVIEETIKGKTNEDAAAALLKLKVCDPASGSGHFIIAAAHRMARRLALLRSGGDEPSPSVYRTALRDVISHCLYAVDINPMAAELCKVNLWIEAMEPGKPLSFLDHHIQVGNSLLGATPGLIARGIPDEAFEPIEGDDKKFCSSLKKRNKQERSGQLDMLHAMTARPDTAAPKLADQSKRIDAMDDTTLAGVRKKQVGYHQLLDSPEYRHARLIADAWCAAFVWRKVGDRVDPITEETFRRLQADLKALTKEQLDELAHLSGQYQFFHWHLAFPEVFQPLETVGLKDSKGWKGGFDILLGNPPWDVFQPEEEKFFSICAPSILSGKTASERKRRIQNLKVEYPGLWQRWSDYCETILRTRFFMGESGCLPLTSYGKTNLYSSFAEAAITLTSDKGRAGIVVPTGIATDEPNKHFMQGLFNEGRLLSLFDFENKDIFPAVHSSFKFCLLTMGRSQASSSGARFAFFTHSVAQLAESGRIFTLTADDVCLLNPNTKTCPIFRGAQDADLTKSVYRRVAAFQVEAKPDGDPWTMELARLFMMDSDSNCFVPADEISDASPFRRLYESKLMHQFDHRFASFKNVPTSKLRAGQAEEVTDKSPENLVVPRFYVSPEATEARYQRSGWQPKWALSLRDITNVTNERTTITCVIPREAAANNLPLIISPQKGRYLSCLCANLNSFVLDYVSRQKVGGTHINLYLLQQFPVVTPSSYAHACLWSVGQQSLRDWLLSRLMELTYTAWDMEPFARDCDWFGPPFRWEEGRRFLLRCELDAAFFHLYLPADATGDWKPARTANGCPRDETPEELVELKKHFPTPRDAVSYIMDTFPIVKRKDEEKYGTYRTKDTILAIYDAMSESIRTGRPYQTRLDPPPADPKCCHPMRAERII